MSAPDWTLNDDGETVTVYFPTAPSATFRMDAREIDSLVKDLGYLRGALEPTVPSEPPVDPMVLALDNPTWRISSEVMEGNTLLRMRDPRYGWLDYLIPREEARRLIELLQDQLELDPAQPTDRPN